MTLLKGSQRREEKRGEEKRGEEIWQHKKYDDKAKKK